MSKLFGKAFIFIILLSLLLYPFWNIILVGSYFSGIDSALLNQLKTIIPFTIIIIIYTQGLINLTTSKTLISFLMAITIFFFIVGMFSIIITNNRYSLNDLIIIHGTTLLYLGGLFLSELKIRLRISDITLNLLIKLFTYVSILVIAIGFLESFFISNHDLTNLNYYYFIGMAKGLDIHTYGRPVPDNLYTMIDGLRIRRMVSIIGEPLYLSYFIIIPSIYFFVKHLLYRRNLFMLIFFFLAILFTISKYIIGVFFISTCLILIISKRDRGIISFVILLFSPLILLILNNFVQFLHNNDRSFKGHMNSFVHFVKYIEENNGLFLPNAHSVLNNFTLLKYGDSNFVVESGLLILLSNIGVFGFVCFLILLFFFYRKKIKELSFISDNRNENLQYCIIVAYPFIHFGYFITIIFSPHFFTFQILLCFNAFSLLYILCYNSFKSKLLFEN